MEYIGFVILHYKDISATDNCIRSILKLNGQDRIKIIVVDNDVNELPDVREKLKLRYSHKKRVTVLKNEGTGGFSEANNLGFLYAKHTLNCNYIIVLNNDIEVPQVNFIELLEQAYKGATYNYGRKQHDNQTEKGRIACHILAPDIIKNSFNGEHQNPFDTEIRSERQTEITIQMNKWALKCFDFAYPFLLVWQRHAEKSNVKRRSNGAGIYGEILDNIVPFGAFLIFTPEFVEEQDRAFDPETPFFYEEYILALRCRRLGYRIVYDPSMKVLHESGRATKMTYRKRRDRMKFTMEQMLVACRIYREYMGNEK